MKQSRKTVDLGEGSRGRPAPIPDDVLESIDCTAGSWELFVEPTGSPIKIESGYIAIQLTLLHQSGATYMLSLPLPEAVLDDPKFELWREVLVPALVSLSISIWKMTPVEES